MDFGFWCLVSAVHFFADFSGRFPSKPSRKHDFQGNFWPNPTRLTPQKGSGCRWLRHPKRPEPGLVLPQRAFCALSMSANYPINYTPFEQSEDASQWLHFAMRQVCPRLKVGRKLGFHLKPTNTSATSASNQPPLISIIVGQPMNTQATCGGRSEASGVRRLRSLPCRFLFLGLSPLRSLPPPPQPPEPR